ncbi:MAG: hypothetical protein AAF846_21825 [Chloroflexota bacterium]
MNNAFNLNKAIENQLGYGNTLDPRSAKLFDKVLKSSTPNVIDKLLRNQPKPILVLDNLTNEQSVSNRHYRGARTVSVANIHGTIDRDGDFSYNFAPLKRNSEHRWCRVATAMLNGIALPPVDLVQVGDDYFVKDGHHRVSVARALGFNYIDAIVVVWA